MNEFDRVLDTSGLNCPLPLLKTKKELVTMGSGQTLHVISTDPSSVVDFHAFAAQSGNELLESRQEDDVFHFVFKKK